MLRARHRLATPFLGIVYRPLSWVCQSRRDRVKNFGCCFESNRESSLASSRQEMASVMPCTKRSCEADHSMLECATYWSILYPANRRRTKWQFQSRSHDERFSYPIGTIRVQHRASAFCGQALNLARSPCLVHRKWSALEVQMEIVIEAIAVVCITFLVSSRDAARPVRARNCIT